MCSQQLSLLSSVKNLYVCKLYILEETQYSGGQSLEPAKAMATKEVLEELLDTERLKYCFECGICTASCSIAEMLGDNYNPRRLLENLVLNPKKALVSDELWLCAWCYRCHRRCPQALKLPEIFLLMRTVTTKQGHAQPFESALRKIVRNIPLPLVALSVCFHPERAGMDKKKVLEKAEKMREKEFQSKEHDIAAKNCKVAVLGSGPAGLTAAYELKRKGYEITVFEALPESGGMPRKCIPESRLSKRVLAKEVQFMKNLGVELKTGVKIGKDVRFEDLWKDGYKAVFVGVGAHKSQNLKIEGNELKGVIHALDFLWSVNCGEKLEAGKNVIVIGGGNVAIDAAKTALELGAGQVTILYRRSKDEMPAIPWEVREAEDAGVKIEFLVSPKRILGEEGKVTALECVRMQLGEPDESGRKKTVPIEGSEFTLETDMVILAIGEAPDVNFLPKEIELNDDGTLWVNPITMETSLPGVFAGGDVVTGPATVIEAIRAGKQAAESINNYLESTRGS
jgi:NADPH-dependent glutamate synthase beta subunit-like oxidoreductase